MNTVPYTPLPDLGGEVVYEHGPDSTIRSCVPAGDVTEFRMENSALYPGVSRRVWIHRTAGLRDNSPAPVMVFNDGGLYFDHEGGIRGGVVLDNLVADGSLPPMIGVFVDPGMKRDAAEEPHKNRNVEYDAFDERYADFLTHEVLPLVAQRVNISDDPALHGICGGSSGGNAALTAAWCRPESFRRVIAFNSSFAQMPGGNPYPRVFSSAQRKPLRIFLHAAQRDLNWNEPKRNWFGENLKIAAALAEAGYDFRLVVGDGGHSPNHGGVLLPDAMRWLWKEGQG